MARDGLAACCRASRRQFEDSKQLQEQLEGPFPFDDRFAVYFKYEVTPKMTGKKMTMNEVGLYYVQNGKVVREEFYFGAM